MAPRRRYSPAASCRFTAGTLRFFAVAALVAVFPYGFGLAIWLAASLAAYLAVMRAFLPRPETLRIAAAFLAVPLLSRGVARATGIPLGLLLLLATFVFIMRGALLHHKNA